MVQANFKAQISVVITPLKEKIFCLFLVNLKYFELLYPSAIGNAFTLREFWCKDENDAQILMTDREKSSSCYR